MEFSEGSRSRESKTVWGTRVWLQGVGTGHAEGGASVGSKGLPW